MTTLPLPIYIPPNKSFAVKDFGKVLSINRFGTTLAVSTTKQFYSEQGRVFIYELDPADTWKLRFCLAPPNDIYEWNEDNTWSASISIPGLSDPAFTGKTWINFGASLAMSEDGKGVLVGAPKSKGVEGLIGGAIYFQRDDNNSWTQPKGLFSSKVFPDGSFGTSVACYGEYLAVGEPENDAVYLFDKRGKFLNIFKGKKTTNFGAAIALSENTLAVCAPQEKTGGAASKKIAYLYTIKKPGDENPWKNTFNQTLKIDDASLTNQGDAIAIHETQIVVGSSSNKSVYVFTAISPEKKNLWKETKVQTLNSKPVDGFGRSIDFKDFGIVIGSNDKSGFLSKFSKAKPANIPAIKDQKTKGGKTVAIGGNTLLIADPDNNTVYVKSLGTGNTYIRDTFKDDGKPQAAIHLAPGALCASPDVIPATKAVLDPEKVYGAKEWTQYFQSTINQGRKNYVYIRMHNIGNGLSFPASNLYYTDPGTFNAPDQWKVVGNILNQPVWPGEKKVFGPVVWEVPKSILGHYCVITCLSGLGTSFLQKPEPKNFFKGIPKPTISDFDNLVLKNNGMAFRNVSVVKANNPEGLRSFVVTGNDFHESDRTYLSLLSNLKEGTKIRFKTTPSNAISPERVITCNGNEQEQLDVATFALSGGERIVISPEIQYAADHPKGTYTLTFRQHENCHKADHQHEGQEEHQRVLSGAFRFEIIH